MDAFGFIILLFIYCQGTLAQAVTCSSLQQQSSRYTTTSANSSQYVLACGNDLVGVGDLQSLQTSSMVDCMKACDAKAGCNAVTYWQSNQWCYLKGVSSGRDLNYAPSNAGDFAFRSSLQTCAVLSSASTRLQYTNTRQYALACNADEPFVGDLTGTTGVPAASLIDCVKACDKTASCTAAAYWDTTQMCYLKALVGRGIKPQRIDGITFIYTSGPTSCKSLVSQGRRVKLFGQRDYTLQCGVDAPWQGDIKSVTVGSLNECLLQCDNQQGCTAVVYWESTQGCYMKGLTGTANIQSSNVADMAFLTSSGVGPAPPNKDQTGAWSSPIAFPVISVAAAPVPNSNKIFVWSADAPDSFVANDPNRKFTYFATMDISTRQVSQQTVTNTGHDMFCPGISFDPKGRLIVTGGSTDNAVSLYDFNAGAWSSGTPMNIPRGYHSTTTTSNGKVFALGGSWNGGLGGKMGELFDPNANTWTKLPGCPTDPMVTKDQRGVVRADNHAWLFGWKNGAVFQAGPSSAMNWFSTTGTGGYKSAGI